MSDHPNRVRAFLAMSLDGFIAGPKSEDTFTPFFAEIGAMLMGRRTFDVVSGFGGEWPYGETPILVASSRPLGPAPSTVRRVHGPITEMVGEARSEAGERDVYIDGASLFRSALSANLVDERTVTIVPIILGAGIPLFTSGELDGPRKLQLESSRAIGAGMVQLRYRFPR